jgi:hypothetical protein
MVQELVLREGEGEKLKREIRELREKAAALTAERDDLKHRVCRELEAEYNRRIGVLELTVLMKRIRVLQLRRLLEALQALLNRREQPDFLKEEEKIREESRAYEEDLKDRAEKIRRDEEEEGRRRKKRTEWEERKRREEAEEKGREKDRKEADPYPEQKRISREDESSGPSFTERLKSLYRRIVKLLHPDMNPDVTKEQQALFRDAVRAYKEEDIDRLQEISDLLDAQIFPERAGDSPEDLAKLRKIRDGLLSAIAALEAEIREIKETRPYLYKFFLEDEDAVKERRESLFALIRELDEQIGVLEERLGEMKKKGGTL